MFCLSNCVPMQSALRPDVSPSASDADGGASPRSFRRIGRTVTCYVG